MNLEGFMTKTEAVKLALSFNGAEETYPFDEETLVFKVAGKMFGLVYERNGDVGLNLKCDPDFSLVLRQQYEGIFPGYHMNKKHWNTVLFDSDVPNDEIVNLLNISYEIVVKSLTKKTQKALLDGE